MFKLLEPFPIQTKLVFLAYAIVLFSVFIPFDMNDNVRTKGVYGLNKRLLVFFLMLFPIAASIYTINCLVVGKCETWAWYNAIIIMIWCTGVFFASLTNIKIENNNIKLKQILNT